MLALDGNPPITGMPALPPSTDTPTEGNAAAEAAVRALVGLLDEATTQPLARLKKGGVGARERARLAKRLGINEPALWIDLAAALDMLDPIESGYAAAEQYSTWRDEPVAARWADNRARVVRVGSRPDQPGDRRRRRRGRTARGHAVRRGTAAAGLVASGGRGADRSRRRPRTSTGSPRCTATTTWVAHARSPPLAMRRSCWA